jgi:hypothetical protein
MTQGFACDPEEAASLAQELAAVKDDIHSQPHPLQGVAGTLGTPVVDEALRQFHAAVVQTRAALAESTARTSGRFTALSSGEIGLDESEAVEAG